MNTGFALDIIDFIDKVVSEQELSNNYDNP